MAKINIHICTAVVLFFVGMGYFACDAPRKNPLDTHNPDGTWAELSGTAKLSGSPATPIADIAVIWNDEKYALTDGQGHYSFNQIRATDGWLRFSGDGYKNDSVYVAWDGRKKVSQDIILQAAPVISGRVTSTAPGNPPLSNVSIYWINDHTYTSTNQDGFYNITGIAAKDGLLIFHKDGFRADSINVEWSGASSITQNIQMAPLPTIQGHVKTSRVPPVSLSGVKVTWSASQQFVFTDAEGFYQFENLDIIDGQLVYEIDGYRTNVEEVLWGAEQFIVRDVFLNANPRLDSLMLYSVVEHNYGDRTVEQMNVFAYLDDDEDDIKSVFLQCSPLDINAELSYNVQHKRFERIFSVIDLNIATLRETVGHNFHLVVQDDYNDFFDLGVDRVERVISDEIEVDAPKNSDQVGNPISLQWLYFNPGFPFFYDVEIYTDDDFTQELVWSKKGVPADSLSTIVDEHLDAKEYVWMIWCVDEFNNRSRSKPGSFSVAD